MSEPKITRLTNVAVLKADSPTMTGRVYPSSLIKGIVDSLSERIKADPNYFVPVVRAKGANDAGQLGGVDMSDLVGLAKSPRLENGSLVFDISIVVDGTDTSKGFSVRGDGNVSCDDRGREVVSDYKLTSIIVLS